MNKLPSILIFGGSFDPPHLGHLNVALKVHDFFQFDQFIFLPCKTPLLKANTQTSISDRLTMLQLLIAEYPFFTISTKEVDRETPSYMYDTLIEFRKDFGNHVSINLLVGMDAYFQLPQWHKASELQKLCNLLIIERNHQQIKLPRDSFFSVSTHKPLDLLYSPYGKKTIFNAGDYPISSTTIRHEIQQGKNFSIYLPPTISEYISTHHLYGTCQ